MRALDLYYCPLHFFFCFFFVCSSAPYFVDHLRASTYTPNTEARHWLDVHFSRCWYGRLRLACIALTATINIDAEVRANVLQIFLACARARSQSHTYTHTQRAFGWLRFDERKREKKKKKTTTTSTFMQNATYTFSYRVYGCRWVRFHIFICRIMFVRCLIRFFLSVVYFADVIRNLPRIWVFAHVTICVTHRHDISILQNGFAFFSFSFLLHVYLVIATAIAHRLQSIENRNTAESTNCETIVGRHNRLYILFSMHFSVHCYSISIGI